MGDKITVTYEINFYMGQEVFFLSGTTIGKAKIKEISIIEDMSRVHRSVKIDCHNELFQIDKDANNAVFYTLDEAIEVLKERVQ